MFLITVVRISVCEGAVIHQSTEEGQLKFETCSPDGATSAMTGETSMPYDSGSLENNTRSLSGSEWLLNGEWPLERHDE